MKKIFSIGNSHKIFFVGFSFFGYLPDIYIYTGLILIVSSGIYIFIREQKKISNN